MLYFCTTSCTVIAFISMEKRANYLDYLDYLDFSNLFRGIVAQKNVF